MTEAVVTSVGTLPTGAHSLSPARRRLVVIVIKAATSNEPVIFLITTLSLMRHGPLDLLR